MKQCKKCKTNNPEVVMVGKTCYTCILKQWPPKTKKQYRKYEEAVAIRLRLTTPLSDKKTALDIVRKVGLNNLQKVQDIIEGKIVKHMPGSTFYQRLCEELGE